MSKLWCFIPLFLLSACGGVSGQLKDKANEERLLKPGALDLPLTGMYLTYQYKLLDKYRVTHQWIQESNCQYSKLEILNTSSSRIRSGFYIVGDIYEEGNSTKQRGAHPTWNFDRFVRSVKYQQPIYATITSAESEADVEAMLERGKNPKKGLPLYIERKPTGYKEVETGYTPICLETWWATSHSIALFLHKQSLEEMVARFTKWYPEGIWTTKTVNNQTWHMQETLENKFRIRPLNGVAGPYQTWLIPIGETGYTIAMEFGASKESLQYPEAHARMQTMFKHLIESVKIEPIKQ